MLATFTMFRVLLMLSHVRYAPDLAVVDRVVNATSNDIATNLGVRAVVVFVVDVLADEVG